MAVQNKSKSILNINCLENSKNKVYINPNFNRPQKLNNHLSNATMHVNPKFSQFVANSQSIIQNKNKIYINPNFIKSRSIGDGNQCISTSINTHVVSDVQNNVNNSLSIYQHQSVHTEAPALPAPVTHSRYSLVRQVTNKPKNETVQEKPKNTFKLNKYKTVSLKDIKINLANVKNATNINPKHFETTLHTSMNGKVSNSLVINRKNNQFKFTNCSNKSALKQDKIKSKLHIDAAKKMHQSNQANQLRLKKMKGSLKKNNIPCPLFRKFGKCIRNIRGKCQFLHDKKHVSVCRKFIKGLCHDKDCLLSHDLTTKKMPTCYFYLQGTCTKAECPYLHVKLNEKTKICADFLKGYCEKGSKCLQRHISLPLERKKPISQRDSFRKKYNESKICQGFLKKRDVQATEKNQKTEQPSLNRPKSFLVKGENCSDNRYYDEHRDDGNTNESFETIKPMRCKLGTLPSFIQL